MPFNERPGARPGCTMSLTLLTLDFSGLQMGHLIFIRSDPIAHSLLWDSNQLGDLRGEKNWNIGLSLTLPVFSTTEQQLSSTVQRVA